MRIAGFPSKFGWILLILTAVVLAGSIALGSQYNAHPDEFLHIDGFCYYQSSWWMPDLNADLQIYSSSGDSRVYRPEAVYWIYGKISRLIVGGIGLAGYLPIPPLQNFSAWILNGHSCHFPIFRVINLGLFAGTLLLLFFVGRKHSIAFPLLALMLSLPQVTYIYAYANSDAWGLSVCIASFLFVFTQGNLLASLKKSLVLGVFTALILLSKQNFWMFLPFLYSILLWSIIADKQRHPRRMIRNGLIALGVILLLVFPMHIYYPFSQGDYTASYQQMLRDRTLDPWHPDRPTFDGFLLASRGVPFQDVIFNLRWWMTSLFMFYGVFGYVNIPLPPVFYLLVFILAVFLLIEILRSLRRWSAVQSFHKYLLACLSLAIVLIFAASLYFSWVQDFQPQGRYLFPMIIYLALLAWIAGQYRASNSPLPRRVAFLVGLLLSFSALVWYIQTVIA